MTITNGYATIAQVTSALWIPDGQDDAELEVAVNAASRWIDKLCGRRFYTDAAATARKFQPLSPHLVPVDDFYTTTDLVVATDAGNDGTYERTWTTADYELDPVNALGPAGQAWPYTAILATNGLTFPTTARRSVQVTARWGWAAVPDDVEMACIRLASFVFRTKDSPLGVAAFTDLGALRARTPTVVLDLLTGFERESAYGAPMVG